VIVRDGLVHSEGLSVYPLGCWVDCWWYHKKLAWHVRIQNRGLFFPFDLFVLIFLAPFLPFSGGFIFLSRLAEEPCGPADFIFHLYGHNLTGSLVQQGLDHRMRASAGMEETRRACR
jgi:hypothetical protein